MAAPGNGVILVAEDDPTNLRLLVELLRGQGYSVRPTRDGRGALRSAQVEAPDLVLLDVHMPELDGYDTCRALKADPRLKEVPVLFLSGLAEPFNRQNAFEAGAVDYITKPFEALDVLARVQVHLRIHKLRLELEASNRALTSSKQLQEQLFAMVAHDMRSPLTVIGCSLDVLIDTTPNPSATFTEIISEVQQSVRTLEGLTTDLVSLHKLEAGAMELNLSVPTHVSALFEETLTAIPRDQRSRVHFQEDTDVPVYWDAALMRRVLINLTTNSLRYGPRDGQVQVSAQNLDGARIRVAVADAGSGIPEDLRERVFEKFFTTSGAGNGGNAGLGLAFCKLAIEAHGGQIGVTSRPGAHLPTEFWFECPLGSEP